MYTWRISKYNSKFRDENGNYTKDEWTSFSDIDKTFQNKKLSLVEYLHIEKLYIDAILLFIQKMQIPYTVVTDLEKPLNLIILDKYKNEYSDEMINIYYNVKNKDKCTIENTKFLVSLILREHLWLKLKYKRNFFIHFGYDLYMYIGSNKKDSITNDIVNMGLYIEEYPTP